MAITLKETDVVGDYTRIGVVNDEGLVVYDRFFLTEDWTSDPVKSAVQLEDYLKALPSHMESKTSENPEPVEFSDKALNAKRQEIAQAEAAVEDGA